MYHFTKVKTRYISEEYLLVFRQGEIQEPILALNKKNIADLNKEWKSK